MAYPGTGTQFAPYDPSQPIPRPETDPATGRPKRLAFPHMAPYPGTSDTMREWGQVAEVGLGGLGRFGGQAPHLTNLPYPTDPGPNTVPPPPPAERLPTPRIGVQARAPSPDIMVPPPRPQVQPNFSDLPSSPWSPPTPAAPQPNLPYPQVAMTASTAPNIGVAPRQGPAPQIGIQTPATPPRPVGVATGDPDAANHIANQAGYGLIPTGSNSQFTMPRQIQPIHVPGYGYIHEPIRPSLDSEFPGDMMDTSQQRNMILQQLAGDLTAAQAAHDPRKLAEIVGARGALDKRGFEGFSQYYTEMDKARAEQEFMKARTADTNRGDPMELLGNPEAVKLLMLRQGLDPETVAQAVAAAKTIKAKRDQTKIGVQSSGPSPQIGISPEETQATLKAQLGPAASFLEQGQGKPNLDLSTLYEKLQSVKAPGLEDPNSTLMSALVPQIRTMYNTGLPQELNMPATNPHDIRDQGTLAELAFAAKSSLPWNWRQGGQQAYYDRQAKLNEWWNKMSGAPR